ncbi:coiled-coil domain-containing protein 110-like [Impatiens glandulifera]|uniref:coiled-coil domain-containing protein 110-like n=1 Tax=Impatiens glandulifera TaxID=253017 RepID=UPI001FB0904F|nr:coiled-coil domain-containing protein 110-like [Impatiens glandulifera]
MEEEVLSLTKATDVTTSIEQNSIVQPHARLQRLTEHIQRLQEKYNPETPNSQLQLLVIELLTVKEREITEEVARLEMQVVHLEKSNSSKSEDVGGQNPTDEELPTPPPDQTINITEVRTSTPSNDQRGSFQTGNSEPAVMEERVKTLIEEFVNDAVQPWKKKIKETAAKVVEIAETIRDDLGEAVKRITSVETNYGNTDQLYGSHLERTKDLEAITPKLVTDLASVSKTVAEMERSQEKTDQRLTKVEEDLAQSSSQAGSTFDRVIILEEKNTTLEEKNAKLEADLKEVTEQVAELITAKLVADKAIEEANTLAAQQLQDALDKQTQTQKEAAAADANIAGHMQNLAVNAPAIVKSIAAQEAEDAKQLKAQQETYNNFAKAHKRSQAVVSSSVPVTRKRKAASKKAQLTGLLDRITETIIDPPPTNPAMQTEDDFEEELEPQPPLRRQRCLNVTPIRSIGQPFSPQTGTSGGQGPSSRPAKGQTTDKLME